MAESSLFVSQVLCPYGHRKWSRGSSNLDRVTKWDSGRTIRVVSFPGGDLAILLCPVSGSQGPLAGWFSVCRGWGAGVVVLWRGVLSTSASGGGGQFIVQASVRGPLECHGVPHGLLYVLQHPYDGAQGRADGSELLPEPQILFLLHALDLLKLCQDRSHRLLGVVVCSHDGGEGLVESGFPWPVRPLSHSSPPSSPVVVGVVGYPGFPVVVETQLIDVSWVQRCVYLELSNVAVFWRCVCILSAAVCTANGIPQLKNRRVDSWVVIAWAFITDLW
ncbi:hypothetical protein NDU88_005853 [Pleurodeles waltl]|uniref:Uncharacterized protein n=1 Tax=Pleurodeles waltl TaxID=8319 RepID=A0AAV7QG05_PLEWA|nr:hypothetical protein NDU88_005853 [Pleurodeles waltl]